MLAESSSNNSVVASYEFITFDLMKLFTRFSIWRGESFLSASSLSILTRGRCDMPVKADSAVSSEVAAVVGLTVSYLETKVDCAFMLVT